MRKLDTSAVSTTVAMPVKSGTWQHIQLAYQEAIAAMANNLIGVKSDSTHPYVLYGCVKSGSGPYDISAGAIYYNGEVYLVDATTGITLSGNVIVGTITTTQYTTNADPVPFTDGVSRNIHNIQKIVFAAGTSGSGTFDFTALRQCGVGLKNDQQSSLGSTYVVTFEQDKCVFFNSASIDTEITFDFTDAVPGAVVSLEWTWGSGRTLTVTAGGSQTILLDSGDPTKCASNHNSLYFIYKGKNSAGNDQVNYSVNQTV